MAVTDDLRAIRDDLVAIVKAQTEAWMAAGCPPTMSIDGESYDWNGWLKSKTDAIKDLTEQIQLVGGTFLIRSRGRS